MGAMIPLPVMASHLSQGAKLCYGALCGFAGQNGDCYPSERLIGERLSVSERQARSYISELVRTGYVERERAGRKETNRYYFLWRPEFNEFDLDRRNPSSRDRKNTDGKEIQSKRLRTDSDYVPRIAKRDSLARHGAIRSLVSQTIGPEISDSALGRIVAAGGGANDEQIIWAIKSALSKSPKTPIRARWFEVAVAEHFEHAAGLRPAAPASVDQRMDSGDAVEMAEVFGSLKEAVDG